MDMKTKYVCGFLFDSELKNVVLIKKEKPEWQKGFHNGVGGKIEKGETPEEAMTREFEEEAGVKINHWELFAKIKHQDYEVSFFREFGDELITKVRQMEKEQIIVIDSSEIESIPLISNLLWLIPMAKDYNHQMANLTCIK